MLYINDRVINHNKKGTKMELYDIITNYGITIKDGELYLVKDGVEVKLADNERILKEYNDNEGRS